MKPHLHAAASAKRYGGNPDEYFAIHDFMDSSKSALPDVRHRAILHSSFGCYIVEEVFGATFTNSVGKIVSTRDVAEDHIIEDLGFIPTLDKWFANMPIDAWMGGPSRKTRHISYEGTEQND